MYVVYQHQLRTTLEIVYYGSGSEKRPFACNGGARRNEEHRRLMLAGQILVTVISRHKTISSAERKETKLIEKGRVSGFPLFNKISCTRELRQAGGRSAGKVNGAAIRDAKKGIFSDSCNRSENARKAGVLPWWHNKATGETKRSFEKPDVNFSRGRGKLKGK